MNDLQDLKPQIYTIRGKQVMLDRDLAELYGVETKYLKRQVRRNIERFPVFFCFELSDEEFENWRSQFVTSNSDKKGLRYSPFAFTEQGVSMLSTVLKSDKAIEISIQIMEAFIQMRHFLQENASIFQRLDRIELKQLEYDSNFNQIFKAIERKQLTPNQGIFFDGQLFDAHTFIINLIKQAKKEIILIDNYIDEVTLTLLSNKKENIQITIYTKEITKQLHLATEKFNTQYNNLTIKSFNKSHDRFLIIDDTTYHLGASLKDAGKKWFAFSILKDDKDLREKLV
ncbi:MAG: ORF6N domain-containing protein [Candidatus Woesearchaeota archaeon]